MKARVLRQIARHDAKRQKKIEADLIAFERDIQSAILHEHDRRVYDGYERQTLGYEIRLSPYEFEYKPGNDMYAWFDRITGKTILSEKLAYAIRRVAASKFADELVKDKRFIQLEVKEGVYGTSVVCSMQALKLVHRRRLVAIEDGMCRYEDELL